MRIGVVLKTLSISSWGTGIEELEADVITAKFNVNGKTVPIIPSTSFRGVLRTEAFRVARLLVEERLYNGLRESCRGINPRPQAYFPTRPCGECAVCILFGSPGQPPSPLKNTFLIAVKDSNLREVFSKKIFYNGFFEKMELLDDVIEELTFIALDDSTNVVKEGALYTMEVVPPHTYFYGEIELKEPLLNLHLSRRSLGEEARKTIYRLLVTSLKSLDYADAGRGGVVSLEKLLIEPGQSDNVFKEDDFLSSFLKWGKVEVIK